MPAKKSWGDLFVRMASAFVLMAVQFLIIFTGKWAVCAELYVVGVLGFREFLHLGIVKEQEGAIPFFSKYVPYVLFTLLFVGLNGSYFTSTPYLTIGVFATVCLLMIIFIRQLRLSNLRYSLIRFSFGFSGIAIIGIPINLMIRIVNISMFWFLLPLSLVIMNDSAAYFCGRMFGRHKLIELSPNKTIEGFLGAAILTLAFGWGIPYLVVRAPLFYCPSFHPFEFDVTCTIPSYFVSTLSGHYPAGIHSVIFAAFASFIAPYGGFLASGLKRAMHIKDFGSAIPGHGGIIDRIDCQLVMAVFAYIYLHTFLPL